MSAGEAAGSLWSDLVNGLLDARTDHATPRFDAELSAAVAAGELTTRAAQRIRFWQRAAVNALDDHARTVLPAMLGALDASDAEARAYVEQSAAMLDAGEAGPDAVTGPTPTPTPKDPPGAVGPERPPATPGPPDALERPPTAAEQAVRPPAPERIDLDDARRASTSAGSGPSTLEGSGRRLFVADLRDVPTGTDHP